MRQSPQAKSDEAIARALQAQEYHQSTHRLQPHHIGRAAGGGGSGHAPGGGGSGHVVAGDVVTPLAGLQRAAKARLIL